MRNFISFLTVLIFFENLGYTQSSVPGELSSYVTGSGYMDLHGGPFLALFYPMIMQIIIARLHFVMEDHGCNLLLELKHIQSTTACFA